jgi:hypothetical protein
VCLLDGGGGILVNEEASDVARFLAHRNPHVQLEQRPQPRRVGSPRDDDELLAAGHMHRQVREGTSDVRLVEARFVQPQERRTVVAFGKALCETHERCPLGLVVIVP